MDTVRTFVYKVDNELLPNLNIQSVNSSDPIEVRSVPVPWKLLGAGNYAAGLQHPEFPEYVVKVYAPGRPGLHEEVTVYNKIGSHPAYSQCYHSGDNYLVLKFLNGVTFYECLKRGIRIPESVIEDIDNALQYAKNRGLYPHDVHAKNVMVVEGRGVVVDISDFYKDEYCSLWKDVKKAYKKVYRPFLYRFPIPIPEFLLNTVRKGYRLYKRIKRRAKKSDNL
ncbi:MAG: serine/threonine protein kinase [Clostridia bacterium]|nr:serine/threonine protein kinase [Clostridia bacterium]